MNTHALLKISEIIREDLIPTLDYEDKEKAYKIADALDMLVCADRAGMPISLSIVYDYTEELLEEGGIHDLLGSFGV